MTVSNPVSPAPRKMTSSMPGRASADDARGPPQAPKNGRWKNAAVWAEDREQRISACAAPRTLDITALGELGSTGGGRGGLWAAASVPGDGVLRPSALQMVPAGRSGSLGAQDEEPLTRQPNHPDALRAYWALRRAQRDAERPVDVPRGSSEGARALRSLPSASGGTALLSDISADLQEVGCLRPLCGGALSGK